MRPISIANVRSLYALRCSNLSTAQPPLIARRASTKARQWSTPLAESLAKAISTTGPISIANYMRQCLTSPDGGYYTSKRTEGKDHFGKTGDFVTSPEISQIFGELVGIWFVAEWIAQGRKEKGVEIIELGPGRGTLMADVLRTISKFEPMANSVETVYLVEASKTLRNAQKELLCGPLRLLPHDAGFQSQSKQIQGTNVVWVEDINFKPKEPGKTPFIIAHEFFDALPIHAFQSVTQIDRQVAQGITTTTSSPPLPPPRSRNEWRELLVSPTPPPSVINPPRTPGPEFEITLAPAPNNYSRLLPGLSARYSALLSTPGSTIEISAEARTTTTLLSQMIGGIAGSSASAAAGLFNSNLAKNAPSGAALIVDYGPSSSIPISTLRGIRSHERCSPFTSPGAVDLSVDVDFGGLVETALSSSEGVEVHGPVEQADWLASMGGQERCDALIREAGVGKGMGTERESDEVAKRITSGWERLVDRGVNGMGKMYKVMAIVPECGGKRKPVGFGGDVDP